MRDPKNQKSSMGFIVTGEHPSIDKEEHLKALVKLGALTKKTYRFENRKNTRENTKRWMMFASGRKDILEATAEYFEPKTKPLQFTFWYLPSAKDDVKKFVNELKN